MDRPSRQPPPGSSRPEREPVPSVYSYSNNDSISPLPLLYSTPSYEAPSRVQFQEQNGLQENERDPEQQQSLAPGFSASDFRRQKSLVRPDRERVDQNHRLFNYRNHAAAMEAEGRGMAEVSRTGHYASAGLEHDQITPNVAFNDATNLRRGKSILAREEGMANESGLSMFKRAATLRRNTIRRADSDTQSHHNEKPRPAPQTQPLGIWMIFCLTLTLCCPSPMLKCFGLRTKERQSAWREKMGLLAVIGLGMTAVGFLTFGFTASVCGTQAQRFKSGEIGTGSMIYHGYAYDLDKFKHPGAPGIANGSNPLYNLFGAASMDGSFLFQTVNERCLNIITPAPGTGIPFQGNKLGWYFPCNLYNQWGSSFVNQTGYAEGALCHTQTDARSQFAALQTQGKILGQVYFNWSDLKNETRNLGVYNGAVLDFSLLRWLNPSQVSYPPLFDEIKNGNSTYRGRDITAFMAASGQRALAECMVDAIRVGFIDSTSIGCVSSDVVLYVSLAVIIGVVVLRFFMAVVFAYFLSWKIGRYKKETPEQRHARALEIESWTEDIYRPAPARYRPNVKKTMLPKTSRFSKGDLLKSPVAGSAARPDSKYGDFRKAGPPSMYGAPPSVYGGKSMLGAGMRNSPPGTPGSPSGGFSGNGSRSSGSSLNFEHFARQASADGMMGACPFPLHNVIPQPPSDFEPFNYPLVHTILLVTAYSESFEGLRTTLDSLATTDYPNSHKVILVIADGMVKGSGNNLTTPEIALSMMRELIIPAEDVEALSYVAIADGHKRHNRAKVFSGFYDYDNNTVEMSKQQRVPMILVAKVGNELEAHDSKPGNRGKRDSQIVLMAFLQKVMFDERMSAFEYEFFNNLWRCSGVSPDRYETVLCVDADTKVFPDSISRMNSCMVNDPEIMGLCGETKIANKSDSWVTMIQVFEYYVSHHLTKAFESVFGGVTCLPGCFSMYRIKSPKGGEGYWVPILANPDIVEHYSENVVDTLHKKNLLLLGEDRYLTTLMLRTFPRRKMMFCPQAVCKTVVPDTFRVLLSQRRRWINSTVHNLFELFTVPDLCGVFCFSMRFVVFMELAGTLVLPAAIAFTLYLIIVTIIPGTVKPVISLILLAIILGIPGLLIVLTSRKFAYLGWMIIYLFSLPIWNFVLPAYAFLHMDDFSWGETRKIVGATKGSDDHGDKDGEFDSSHIVMKRWADFERDRRYRSGMHSRDSAYDVIHRSGSPHRTSSNRFSVISSADTYNSGSHVTNEALFRQSSPGMSASANHSDDFYTGQNKYPAQLELPAPLANNLGRGSDSSLGSLIDEEQTLDSSARSNDAHANSGRLARDAVVSYEYPRYAEGYDSDELEREAILGGDSPIIRQSPLLSAGEHSSNGSFYPQGAFSSEPESLLPSPSLNSTSSDFSRSNPFTNAAAVPSGRPARGVSLVDAGPVPTSEGFRVVQRQRRQSQNPAPGPRARNSMASMGPESSSHVPGSLPPGAGPARH